MWHDKLFPYYLKVYDQVKLCFFIFFLHVAENKVIITCFIQACFAFTVWQLQIQFIPVGINNHCKIINRTDSHLEAFCYHNIIYHISFFFLLASMKMAKLDF